MASVYKKKDGNVWYYNISFNDKRYRGSTKTTDKKTAQQIANSIETDLARQQHGLTALNKNSDKFGDIFKDYLDELICAKKTLDIRITVSKHFLRVFQDKPIKTILTADIEEYRRNRRLDVLNNPKNINKKDSEISFRTVNLEISTMHNFFNYCIKKGIIDKNPCTGIKKLNELSRLKTLSDEDINKLINGATNKLTKDLITFLIYTGCRKGEALNLKWDDADLRNGVIAIKGTKTKYDRHVPISKPVKELLNNIERKSDYVFCDKNNKKLMDFKRSFHTACRNAGLKDMHIHDLGMCLPAKW
ncbi:MAG: tyrosine-type recombinase/integrase [bacterium]